MAKKGIDGEQNMDSIDDGPSHMMNNQIGHTLPLLYHADEYVPCSWNLKKEPARRRYWLGVFSHNFQNALQEFTIVGQKRGMAKLELERRIGLALELFRAFLSKAENTPEALPRLDVLEICKARATALKEAGIDDPYFLVKQRENDQALKFLPVVLAELDGLPDTLRIEALARGIFAGNLFDTGSNKAMEKLEEEKGEFMVTRDRVGPRPWLIDDLDSFSFRLLHGPSYHCACLLVDNAGSDIVLGIVPFARELLQRGTMVILAANSEPSLNDITYAELQALTSRLAAIDALIAGALESGRLLIVESGCGTPLIDLTDLSHELCQTVRQNGTDLLVLEGMGRSLESNFEARFTCDCIKTAMIKSPDVADWLGGELYDLVFKFEKAQPEEI
jgi:type II pantothenate kinase